MRDYGLTAGNLLRCLWWFHVRRLVALGWVVGVAALFVVWQPPWQPAVALLGAEALFLAWWLRLKPSNDREWEPWVTVLPRAVVAGDAITIENVRNFDYRSLADFNSRYETRTVHLSNLKGVDIIFCYWGIPWICHPALVFDFGCDGRLCISIELRYRKGQNYSVVRGLYRQQEIIFLVGDERDVILRRTKFGKNEDTYFYHLSAGAEELRAVFLDYMATINGLYETPRWYHVMWANCTTSFYRLPSRQARYDWRVIANGQLDRALYEDGRIDRTLPFAELRRISRVNEIANSAPAEGFGDYIRRELERRRHE